MRVRKNREDGELCFIGCVRYNAITADSSDGCRNTVNATRAGLLLLQREYQTFTQASSSVRRAAGAKRRYRLTRTGRDGRGMELREHEFSSLVHFRSTALAKALEIYGVEASTDASQAACGMRPPYVCGKDPGTDKQPLALIDVLTQARVQHRAKRRYRLR
eukprot:TRINITY_DN1037_c0_g1_i1.p1 TRINITY_DN1037_c0_g1~~TRINITY_DN1037_c0_g1_i1.p1  ORF type:complete len:161 (+),score=22.15 TRINITY_DN1037_c0_g1_i1:323-805(+)